jgi:hypothetical protein
VRATEVPQVSGFPKVLESRQTAGLTKRALNKVWLLLAIKIIILEKKKGKYGQDNSTFQENEGQREN